jgi:anti-anti-sigma factor
LLLSRYATITCGGNEMSKLRQTHQTLMIQGPFDALAAEKLRPEFDRLATSSSGDLTLDLSGVDFIDSSGIGAIVFLYKT